MTTSTKSRTKKKPKPAKAKHAARPEQPGHSPFRRAFLDHRALLLVGLLYVLAIIAESVYAGVPADQFDRIFYVVPVIILKCVVLLLAMGVGAFLRGMWLTEAREKTFFKRLAHAWKHADDMASRYMNADVFAYGCIGLLVMVANAFYFIQKSLAHVLHPYAWDDVFIGLERVLHFGHLPHEFVIALTEKLHLGRVIDGCYWAWFAVMYLGLGFCLFWDRNLKRRLRFLWCFLLSWVLLGSVFGTWFSAAGPLFYHNFFPYRPDPYADFVRYIAERGQEIFPIAYYSGQRLLEWTTNGEMINLNAVLAFPSMHIAVAWAVTLYGFSIRRWAGIAGAVFTFVIYLATVLFGYHYALDSYFSFIAVSVMWWIAGRVLDKRYPEDVQLKRA
jgi:hypothetical protein